MVAERSIIQTNLFLWHWKKPRIQILFNIFLTIRLAQSVYAKYLLYQLFISYFIYIVIFKVHIFWEDPYILKNLHRRFVKCSNGQIYSGDFTKFWGLLRIYELYLTNFIFCLPFSGWLELMTGVADKVVLPGELVVGDNDTGVHVS